MRLSETEYNLLIGRTKEKKKTAARKKKMGNKGMFLQEMIDKTNTVYFNKGIANIQEIPIPITILQQSGGMITKAFKKGRSTLDYRGTINPGIPISFDCKETTEEKGLPMANILDHQIEFMRQALTIGEISFLICYIEPTRKSYFISGQVVLEKWDLWRANKGKRGFNTILVEDMIEIQSGRGVLIDYEPLVKMIAKE